MQQYLILTFIPAVILIIWAIITKIRLRDWWNVVFLMFAGPTVVINAFAIYIMAVEGAIPQWAQILRALLAPTIIPQAYYYFCRQMGTKGSHTVKVIQWLLLLLLLVPSINIELQPSVDGFTYPSIHRLYLNVFNQGNLLYTVSIPSVILLLQAIATCARIPSAARTLHAYELKITSGARSFIIWWGSCIIFIAVASVFVMENLHNPYYSWPYFITYSLMVSIIFMHIAVGLDLNPVQTVEEQEGVNLQEFVEANKELAKRAHRLFLEEKLYLRPGITIDDVTKMLNTNRTYFTRMMRVEFNMSFNEYITKERIEYSKSLLLDTNKTLEDIAMESGFSTASSFSRVFKRLTDATPDAWRKSALGE